MLRRVPPPPTTAKRSSSTSVGKPTQPKFTGVNKPMLMSVDESQSPQTLPEPVNASQMPENAQPVKEPIQNDDILQQTQQLPSEVKDEKTQLHEEQEERIEIKNPSKPVVKKLAPPPAMKGGKPMIGGANRMKVPPKAPMIRTQEENIQTKQEQDSQGATVVGEKETEDNVPEGKLNSFETGQQRLQLAQGQQQQQKAPTIVSQNPPSGTLQPQQTTKDTTTPLPSTQEPQNPPFQQQNPQPIPVNIKPKLAPPPAIKKPTKMPNVKLPAPPSKPKMVEPKVEENVDGVVPQVGLQVGESGKVEKDESLKGDLFKSLKVEEVQVVAEREVQRKQKPVVQLPPPVAQKSPIKKLPPSVGPKRPQPPQKEHEPAERAPHTEPLPSIVPTNPTNPPIPTKQPLVQPPLPTQYNQLEQKLRKLQLMRSRIDQSSQESYSNHNGDIDEEQQQQYEENQQYLDRGRLQEEQGENDERGGNIYIVDEKRVEQGVDGGEVFRIGETNYDEMEIRDDLLCEEEQGQQQGQQGQKQSQQPNPAQDQHPHPSKDFTQLSSSSQPLSPDQSTSLRAAPADTIVQSNLSVQQTQHQYLPDQVPNSPLQSQGSIPKHHRIHNDKEDHLLTISSNNNVAHADKYRSQMNFTNVENGLDGTNEVEARKHCNLVKKEKEDGIIRTISEKSDGELVRPGHEELENLKKKELRAKDESLQVNRDVDDEADEDNTEQPQRNPITPVAQDSTQPPLTTSRLHPTPSKPPMSSTTQQQIIDLLAQYTTLRSSYLSNLQSYKRTSQLHLSQQLSYQQRIDQLITQVNHKNVMILRHVNRCGGNENATWGLDGGRLGKSDIIVGQQQQVEEL